MTATDSTTLDDRTIAELTTQMWGDSIRGPADRMIETIGSPAAIALVSAGAVLWAALRLYQDHRRRTGDTGPNDRPHSARQRWMLMRAVGVSFLAASAVVVCAHPWATAIVISVGQPRPSVFVFAVLCQFLCGPAIAAAIVRLSIATTDADYATPADPRSAPA